MLNRLFGPKTHNYLHLLGLTGVAVGLPLSKVVMSISMMFLVLNLLLEADFKGYFNRLKSNRLFHLVLAFFLFHIVALLWTSDFDFAMHDLRVKLPLLVISVVTFSRPLENSTQLSVIFGAYLAAMLLTSFINFAAYHQVFGEWHFNDIRGMSLFASHVRYSLLIAFGAAIVLLHPEYRSKGWVITRIAIFVWFLSYTYFSQVLSGYLSLSGVIFIGIAYWIWQFNRWISIAFSVISILSAVIFTIWLFKPISIDKSEFQNLQLKTAEGNLYYHGMTTVSPETHKPIDYYVCDLELEREWEKVSQIPYSGSDLKGQPLRTTLIRYLASMDVKRDAEGFKSLSDEDIKKVEKGNASKYNVGLLARLYGLQFQLNNETNPNGHSFLQRREYWKTGLVIARNNLWIGVGTGDVQNSFDQTYEDTNSSLSIENRRRAHNMYLTVLITFGVLGLFLFLWLHTEFLFQALQEQRMVAVAFIIVILLSYTIEDTLETQTGITFFALFYGLLARPKI